MKRLLAVLPAPTFALALGALSSGALAQASPASEQAYLEDLPVVLSVSRLAQTIEDTPAAVTIIDRTMIRRSGARTVAELMRLAPGFLVQYFDGGARPYATYHGDTDAFNRHLQVYVDGRSVYSGLLLGSATYGMLDVAMEEIERIEVIRGSNSAAQGANAFLGVLNITTRHTADTLGAAVVYRGGEGGIQDTTLRYGWGDEQASFRVNAMARRDNGFDSRYDSSDQQTISLRADLRPSTRDELVLLGGHSGFDWNADVGVMHTEGHRSNYGQLRWRHSLDDGAEFSVNAFADEEQYFNFFPSRRTDGVVKHHGFDGQLTVRPSDNLRIVAGGEFRKELVTSADLFSNAPDQANTAQRLFSNIEWRVFQPLLLNIGGLWEKHSINGERTAPRFAANLKLAPGHTVRWAATTGYKVPNQFETRTRWFAPAAPGGASALAALATGGAKPERIDSTELGYFGDIKALRLTIDFRGFQEKVRSILRFNGRPTDVINKEPLLQQGWETQIRWSPFADTQLLANHTQLRVNPDPVGGSAGDIYKAPRHFSTLGLFQKLPWELDLTVIQSFVGPYMIVPAANGMIPEYRQTDIRLAKAFRMGNLRSEFSLDVQSIEGVRFDYAVTTGNTVKLDRRAFATLRLEY